MSIIEIIIKQGSERGFSVAVPVRVFRRKCFLAQQIVLTGTFRTLSDHTSTDPDEAIRLSSKAIAKGK